METAMSDLTADRLRELLHYDADTGVFRWAASRGRKHCGGDIAGSPCGKGYLQIRVDRRLYKAHRLAWLHVNGSWPTRQIDHIDGNKSNNAIANLREANHSQNGQNKRTVRPDSKSGMLGAYWSAEKSCWYSKIGVMGKYLYLGRFDSPEEAHAAYMKAKAELHPFHVSGGEI